MSAASPGPQPDAAPRLRSGRRRAKVAHLVASEVVRDIVQRDLKPGDRLPTEAAMLDHFDVGRASIREAMRMLEAFGLVDIRQGQSGGPVVSSVQPDDLARCLSFHFHAGGATYGDLHQARLLIEPAMVRFAAERQDPDRMAQLRKVMAAEQEAPLGDPEYLNHANAFHYVVSGMSGNRVLDLLGRGLRSLYQLRTNSGAQLPPEEARPHTRAAHLAIGEAILDGDGDRAEALMREHLTILGAAQERQTPTIWQERIRWEL